MKNLKARILSVILSATVLASALPFMASAYETKDYDVVIYEEAFDGKTSIGNMLTYKESKWNSAEVVSATDKGIADADAHGDVVEVAKRETTPEEVGYDNNGKEKLADNYFRILYNAETIDNIDDMFIDDPEALRYIKIGFDININSLADPVNIRFYDNITGSSTKGSNLIYISENGNFSFLNGGKMDYENGKWYSFEVYLDFVEDKYTAVVNGEVVADKLRFTNLTDCITSFGLQNGSTHNSYSIYMDNISFAIPESSLIPANLNTVWENDFEFVKAADGAYPSGSLSSKSQEVAEIDYKPENCDWEILEEKGNKYYHFKENSSGTANTGNIETGYFKVSGEDIKDKNVFENCSFLKNPYAIDVFPINKVRVDFSVKFDALITDATFSHYYRGTMNNQLNTPFHILTFTAGGDIWLYGSSEAAGTYTPGQWQDITLYIDYTKHKIYCFIDGEFSGETTIGEAYTHFNQYRFRIPKGNGEAGISLDNIRYSTPYNQDYIDRKLFEGYTATMAEANFDNLTPTDKILRGTGGISGAPFTVVEHADGTREEETGNYYVQNSSDVIEIVYDGDKEENVAWVRSASGYFGLGRVATREFTTFEDYGKYPSLVKLELDVKKVSTTACYVSVDGTELIGWLGANTLRANNGGTKVTNSAKTYPNNEWLNLDIYMDFDNRVYYLYAEDELVGKYIIPSAIQTPERVNVYSNNLADNVYVDNIKVSTLEAFAADVITDYKDFAYNSKYAYVLNNADTENAYTYGVYCAKYSADGSLENISISEENIAADTLGFKTLEKIEASDGGYYTYFIWEDMINLKPLIESKTIN